MLAEISQKITGDNVDDFIKTCQPHKPHIIEQLKAIKNQYNIYDFNKITYLFELTEKAVKSLNIIDKDQSYKPILIDIEGKYYNVVFIVDSTNKNYFGIFNESFQEIKLMTCEADKFYADFEFHQKINILDKYASRIEVKFCVDFNAKLLQIEF